jgi:hypothetical protein
MAELLPHAAPLFLLAVPLLAGRYVGEDPLERIRYGLRRRPRRAPGGVVPPARRVDGRKAPRVDASKCPAQGPT